MPPGFHGAGLPALVLSVAIGLAAGVGAYTFAYARGPSYLTDEPTACANCHAMREHHEGWRKGPHHAVAVCNDCHTPHGPAKYVAKALNGYHHSAAFTAGDFAEPIQITARNRAITEAQCRRCHADVIDAVAGPHHGGAESCLRCHGSVGHLE